MLDSTVERWPDEWAKSSQECPLEVAVFNANAPLVKALLDTGLNMTNFEARSSLGYAVAQNSMNIVHMMVEAGADPAAGIGDAVAYRRLELLDYLEKKGAREEIHRSSSPRAVETSRELTLRFEVAQRSIQRTIASGAR